MTGQRGRPRNVAQLTEFDTPEEGMMVTAFDPDDIAEGVLEEAVAQAEAEAAAPFSAPADNAEREEKEKLEKKLEEERKAQAFQEKVMLKEPKYDTGNARMVIVLDILQPFVTRGMRVEADRYGSVTISFGGRSESFNISSANKVIETICRRIMG